MSIAILFAGAILASQGPAAAEAQVRGVMASEGYRSAIAQFDREHDRIVSEIVTLTEIPAPPFQESRRAAAYRDMLAIAGLEDVELDAEGNAMGLYRGSAAPGGPVIVIAAHLDTVFPEGTKVTVRREGTRLYAPGVGDDTRSLAALLAFARAMKAGNIRPATDILFVGNVGEEGPGDLRGVRHLLTKGKYHGRVKAFLSMDGTDVKRVVNAGVGSKRYRVTYKGPGGHSYSAFGIVNPMVAMSRTVTGLYGIDVPAAPKTTYSASVTAGGTSVNSIPTEVFMEFDMRSESPAELAKLESRFIGLVEESTRAENAARSTSEGKVSADLKVIGDRPAGTTPETSALVQTATAAIRAAGLKPQLAASSTDSNMAMSLGIPAVTIGSGGSGGRAHSLDEWIDVEKSASVAGMAVGLAILLAAAEIE